MKQLSISDELINAVGESKAGRFCAPILIGNTFSGTFLAKKEALTSTHSSDFIRNGTVTFLNFEGELLALTCNHVKAALDKANAAWKAKQFEKYQVVPPVDGFKFFTPRGYVQHSFNYQFTTVPADDDGTQQDVAIARINASCFDRIEREPIVFLDGDDPPIGTLPVSGVACGYPEQQRSLSSDGSRTDTLGIKFVACTATMTQTANGKLIVEDSVEELNGVDVLSGMSGGPIFWSKEDTFSLAGIVFEGADMAPGEGRLMTQPGICIFGEPISSSLLRRWLTNVPPLTELPDGSKTLVVPKGGGPMALLSTPFL